MKRLNGPVEVQIELTERCNLKCFHCYNYWKYNNIPESKEIGTEDHLVLLEKLNFAGVGSVTFTGGEPFVRADLLFEMIKRAKQCNMEVGVNTNATLIQRRHAEILASIGTDHILCSLLGIKDTHDNITGVTGSFSRAIEGIYYLVSTGIRVAINIVVSKKNINDVFSVGELSKELGAKTFCATPITPPNLKNLKFALSPEEYKETLRTLIDVKKRFSINVDTLEPVTRCMFDEKEDDEFIEFFGNRICSAATTSCVISATGSIRPCIHSDIEFGNLFEEKLETTWEKMGFWASENILPKDCSVCKAITLCEGGCRMSARVATGSYCGKDMYMTNPITDKERARKYRPSTKEVLSFNGNTFFRRSRYIRFRKECFGGIVYSGSNIEFCTKEGFDFLKKILSNERFSLNDAVSRASAAQVNHKDTVSILSRLLQGSIIMMDEKGGGEK